MKSYYDDELRDLQEQMKLQQSSYRKGAKERLKTDQQKQEKILQDRINARNGNLSPFRKYREQDGPFQLFVNNQPYTGVNELDLENDEFTKQKQVYDYLREELNNAHRLRQQHHNFNLEQVSNPLDPKLNAVYLRGGPDINKEIDYMKNNPNKSGLEFGRANENTNNLYLNRIHPDQTRSEVLNYNKNSQYKLNDSSDPDLIHTLIHEPTHLNTLIHGKNGHELPDKFKKYNFGGEDQVKQVPGIVHPHLKGYPLAKYPSEVVAFTAGDIHKDFPKFEHNGLSDYLQDTLKYYENQGMKDRYPELYNRYIEKINQISPSVSSNQQQQISQQQQIQHYQPFINKQQKFPNQKQQLFKQNQPVQYQQQQQGEQNQFQQQKPPQYQQQQNLFNQNQSQQIQNQQQYQQPQQSSQQQLDKINTFGKFAHGGRVTNPLLQLMRSPKQRNSSPLLNLMRGL